MRNILILILVLAAAPAGAQSAKTYAAFPTGEGDPDQFTCRPPQRIPDSRLLGPEVCKHNSEWARYRRDGMDVAPDGVHDVKLRSENQTNCRSTTAGGGSTGAGFGMRCD